VGGAIGRRIADMQSVLVDAPGRNRRL